MRCPECGSKECCGGSMSEELERLRHELAKARRTGGRLANVAFNLAQRCGHTLDSNDVSILDSLRKQWDAAMAGGEHENV
jgi:hypothetical protein